LIPDADNVANEFLGNRNRIGTLTSNQKRESAMGFVKCLAVLPFLGILLGTPLLNRVEPLILGMPLILAWIVLWIVLTAVIMGIIYLCDPANRDAPDRHPRTPNP
jgi:hypothetical protein